MNYENDDRATNSDDLFDASVKTTPELQSTNDPNNSSSHEVDIPFVETAPTQIAEPYKGFSGVSDTQPSSIENSEDVANANYGGGVVDDPRDYCDNRRFRAADLILHPDIHETLAINPDDIIRQQNLVKDPSAWMPVPVVEHDGQVCIANGAVFVAAVRRFAPEAEIKTRFISKAEASALRQAETARRPSREPMASSRRALMLSNEGMSHKEIGEKLIVKVPRVSQMITLAKTENKYSALGALIQNRFATSTRFWSDFYATTSACEKADLANPKRKGPSRVEQFEAKIAEIVAQGAPITIDEIRERLGLNEKRKAAKSVRMHGARIIRDGLHYKLAADKKRRTISVDPALSANDFANLLDKIAEFLIEQQKSDGSAK